MKKTLTALFLIQIWWWLLSSCHKEVTEPATIPVQQPLVKEIVNNNLQWSINTNTKIASAILTQVYAPPSPNSADSILAVYVLGDSDIAIKRGDPGNYVDVYYQIEKNVIILHKNFLKIEPFVVTYAISFALGLQGKYLPLRAKVVLR